MVSSSKIVFSRARRAKTAARSGLARIPCATMPCLRGDGKVTKRRTWQSALVWLFRNRHLGGRDIGSILGRSPIGSHDDVTAKPRKILAGSGVANYFREL